MSISATVRSSAKHPGLRRLLVDTHAVTAIEFALVAPLFFLLAYGIFEVALVVWFGGVLNDGANQAARYLRDQTMTCQRVGMAGQGNVNCSAATVAGMRQAICKAVSGGGMSCDASKLKLAVYSADNAMVTPMPPGSMIDERPLNLQSARAYFIMVGYEWGFSLPSSRLLLINSGSRAQLQSRIYASTAERALR